VLLRTLKVPLLSVVFGAVGLIALTALVTRLLSDNAPSPPEGCHDAVLSGRLADTPTIMLKCATEAHVSWKTEAVGEERWLVATCECAPRVPRAEAPDASID
jgi:hypothetical protein